jgi:CRP/FNR family cyclic AMP-dependent transcriptional regulator
MGEVGLELYIITAGRIGISVDPDPTRQVFISELKAGDSLGEMALIDNELRSATAHVLEDTEALALDNEKFQGLLQSYPELSIGMLRALSRRLRALSLSHMQGKKD